MSQVCPLCFTENIRTAFTVGGRGFLECAECDLLSIDPSCDISPTEERVRYDQHKNAADDLGYRAHLDRVRLRLGKQLKVGSLGLDFGSGPTAVLSQIFNEHGFKCDNYDPIFGPQIPKCSHQYDFIVCTEVAEHFAAPRREFELMQSLIKPQGWIAIMTNLREGDLRTPSWWYLRDRTHRCFYSKKTIEVFAEILNWRLESIEDDIVILRNSL